VAEPLNGRDLDEACAKAMGWTPVESVSGRPCGWKRDGFVSTEVFPHRYSTDPATLDEKLAWLILSAKLSRPLYAVVSIDVMGHDQSSACLVQHCADHDVGTCDDAPLVLAAMTGSTIHEAIARLVVAVAEKKP